MTWPVAVVLLLASALPGSCNESTINRWDQNVIQRPSPPGRTGAIAFSPQTHLYVVYGGSSAPKAGTRQVVPLLNDIWQYNTRTAAWTQITPDDNVPTIGATAATNMIPMIGGLFFFGGLTSMEGAPGHTSAHPQHPFTVTNALFRLDIGLRIERLLPKEMSQVPPARVEGSLTLVSPPNNLLNPCLLLFGGRTDVIGISNKLNDTWLYDVNDQTWTEVYGESPTARYGHVAVNMNTSQVFMTGGCDTGRTLPCVFEERAATSSWRFVLDGNTCADGGHWEFVGNLHPMPLPPIRRLSATPYAMLPDSNTLFVFGAASQNQAFTEVDLTGLGSTQLPPVADPSMRVVPTRRVQLLSTLISPAPRSGHTLTAVGNDLVLFGGEAGVSFPRDLWVYVTSGRNWINPDTRSVPVSTLIGVAQDTYQDMSYFLGGCTLDGFIRPDFWMYNTTSNAWRTLEHQFIALHSAAMVAIDHSNVVVVGGSTVPWGHIEHRNPFTQVYNAIQRQFIPIQTDNDPSSRAGHSAAGWLEDDTITIYIFGGWRYAFEFAFQPAIYLNDMHRLTYKNGLVHTTVQWEQIDQKGAVLPVMAGHVSAICTRLHSTVLVVAGGYTTGTIDRDAFSSVLSEVYYMDLDTHTWYKAKQVGIRAPIFMASFQQFGNKLAIFGGLQLHNDTWSVVDRVVLGTFSGGDWLFQELETANANPRFGAVARKDLSGPRPRFQVIGGMTLVDGHYSSVPAADHVTLGCNRGQFAADLQHDLCQPCPQGRYGDDLGLSVCLACPGMSYSPQEGSFTVAQCSVCRPTSCRRGACNLDMASHDATCVCPTGFGGAQCQHNVAAISIGILLALVVVGAIAFVMRRRIKRGFSSMRQVQELQQKLIDESKHELEQLMKVWEIDPSDLSLTKRIDGDCEGAFGEVWLGSWQDREVAVKKLRHSLNFTDSAGSDFDAEVSLIRSIRHKNIVLFYGAGVDEEDCPFLVTEFMHRGALQKILRSDVELSPERLLGFAIDTARGMEFLHTRDPPRIHRDLKSANLLVSDSWVVKVADFGTARLVNQVLLRQPDETESVEPESPAMTTAVGTLVYSAPELLSRSLYGLPADVFSFGVVLYELCTRVEPFSEVSGSYFELRRSILNGLRLQLPATSEYPPSDGIFALQSLETFQDLMNSCLAREPDARPSFTEALAQLEACQVDS
eukprot:m.204765 g.204765  ORF g.204765 m.204765 type:complete len:1187 (-) comp15011_c0_seq7:1474-5034(-)